MIGTGETRGEIKMRLVDGTVLHFPDAVIESVSYLMSPYQNVWMAHQVFRHSLELRLLIIPEDCKVRRMTLWERIKLVFSRPALESPFDKVSEDRDLSFSIEDRREDHEREDLDS